MNSENNNFYNKPIMSRPMFWTVLLSILLHVFIMTREALRVSPKLDTAANEPPPIEVTEITPEMIELLKKRLKESKEKIIAETEDADNKEIDPNATYLSDRNQKVEKQTRSKKIDDFRKKEGSGLKETDTAKRGTIPPTGEEGTKDKSELEIAAGTDEKKEKSEGIKRNWKTLSLKDLSVGGDGGPDSATDDYLNDLSTGDRTLLSTKEFKYFSYYHRIKDLLRQYWKPAVEHKLALIFKKGQRVSSKEMITRLLIMLDTSGGIQKISRLSSSGVKDLDDAAVEAFEKAGPFPNPPKGIVDPDGFVRIRWDFILKANTGPKIQFRRPTDRIGGRGYD